MPYMPPFLPYGRQTIEDDDVESVERILRSDFLTTGPTIAEFESALAKRTGAHEAVVCSSGTAALHLASLALRFRPGDVVAVPSVTFLATANAPRLAGAEIAFSDVDPDTGLMRAEDLEALLDDRGDAIKAVFPVHLAGQVGDIEAICAVARRHGLAVVEDACHALGTSYNSGNRGPFEVGACGHSDMAVFSFHPVKHATMGEGGAITTNDPEFAARARLLRNHGIVGDADSFTDRDCGFDDDGTANPWFYEMSEIGFNYRATDIQCALGLRQMEKLERFCSRRRELVACYDEALAPLAPTVRPLGRTSGCRPAWHLNIVLIDFEATGKSRAVVMNALRTRGIGSQVHYIPVHLQPYYRNRYGAAELRGASEYYRRCLSLPLFPAMTEDDVARVVKALGEAL